MRYLVCIAGCEQAVVDHLGGLSSKKLVESDDVRDLVILPLRAPMTYRRGMADTYLKALSDRVAQLSITEDVSVILVFTDHPGGGTQDFVRSFYPFALAASIAPFHYEASPKFERRLRLVEYVDNLMRTLDGLRVRARLLRDVNSGATPNPLLLPLRNFRSDHVEPEIELLFDTLATVVDPRQALEQAGLRIKAAHPMRQLAVKGKKFAKKKTSYVEDARGLKFKSPGGDRHGIARLLSGLHRPSCILGSRVRLGGPFDALLHYDCDTARGGLDREYPNCHGEGTAPAVATHVNIAPNDAVR